MAIANCPDCGVALRRSLREVPGENGQWTEVLVCPNASNHGTLVDCDNDCGEKVPHPRYHWYSVQGLLGSGRWTCFPRGRLTDWIERAIKSAEMTPTTEVSYGTDTE